LSADPDRISYIRRHNLRHVSGDRHDSVRKFEAYDKEYRRFHIAGGFISERKVGLYYCLFNLFCLSMFTVPVVNNLGMLWVAIEMTTLVSAFLVGFYNNKGSVEAAWKYIIICSVGIIFALLGTILFYYALTSATGINFQLRVPFNLSLIFDSNSSLDMLVFSSIRLII